jgi:hypothetical protein
LGSPATTTTTAASTISVSQSPPPSFLALVLYAAAPWQQGRPATTTTIALTMTYARNFHALDFAPFLHSLDAVESLQLASLAMTIRLVQKMMFASPLILIWTLRPAVAHHLLVALAMTTMSAPTPIPVSCLRMVIIHSAKEAPGTVHHAMIMMNALLMTSVSPLRLPVLGDLLESFAKERQPVAFLATIIKPAPEMMFVLSQTMGNLPSAGGPHLPVVHALTTILAQMVTIVCWGRVVIMRSVSQARQLLVFHVTITTPTRRMMSARRKDLAQFAGGSLLLLLLRLSESK